MSTSDRQFFALLKEDVIARIREKHPSFPATFSAWRSSQIEQFQEELIESVNDSFSEKWFYTHLKDPDSRSIPRIDMLNLMANYLGFEDWTDYKYHRKVSPISNEEDPQSTLKTNPNRVFILIPLLVLVLVIAFVYVLKLFGIDILTILK